MTIEYEEVKIRVPKQVMELLRFAVPVTEMTPEEWIEYTTVDNVRAGLEANDFLPDAKALADKFQLNPVLKDILDDPIK